MFDFALFALLFTLVFKSSLLDSISLCMPNTCNNANKVGVIANNMIFREQIAFF